MKKINRLKPLSRLTRRHNMYDQDFYKWTRSQAKLLRHKDFKDLDIKNLIEEIESLGRSQKRAFYSYFTVLLTHMLKTQYQPEKDCNSWKSSIALSRRSIQRSLQENPSFKRFLEDAIKTGYQDAIEIASIETGIVFSDFPAVCPWTKDEILGVDHEG